jgi:hypothetical protein
VAIGAAHMIKLLGRGGWSNRPRPGRGFGGGGLGDPPTATHRSGDCFAMALGLLAMIWWLAGVAGFRASQCSSASLAGDSACESVSEALK